MSCVAGCGTPPHPPSAIVMSAARAPPRSRPDRMRRTLCPRPALRHSIVGMPEALVIVDFQNDFTPGGALAVPDGDRVAARLNELAASGAYDLVVATRDWHPPDHGSFSARGGIWPEHCVAGTPGAELHP